MSYYIVDGVVITVTEASTEDIRAMIKDSHS